MLAVPAGTSVAHGNKILGVAKGASTLLLEGPPAHLCIDADCGVLEVGKGVGEPHGIHVRQQHMVPQLQNVAHSLGALQDQLYPAPPQQCAAQCDTVILLCGTIVHGEAWMSTTQQ